MGEAILNSIRQALSAPEGRSKLAASLMQPLQTRRDYSRLSLNHPVLVKPVLTDTGWDDWPLDLLTAERVVPADDQESVDGSGYETQKGIKDLPAKS